MKHTYINWIDQKKEYYLSLMLRNCYSSNFFIIDDKGKIGSKAIRLSL